MKTKKIRSMSREEKKSALSDLRRELMKLKSQVKTGLTPDNPSRIRQAKRDIARILTVKEEEE